VKAAVSSEMSPFRDTVTVHYFAPDTFRLKDPVKSFVRFAERTLGWRTHAHHGFEGLCAWIRAAGTPCHFYATRSKHVLPAAFLDACAESGGYAYVGVPTDPIEVFARNTTTQAWTVPAKESPEEAKAVLRRVYKAVCVKDREVVVDIVKQSAAFEDSDDEGDWNDFDSAIDDEIDKETSEMEKDGGASGPPADIDMDRYGINEPDVDADALKEVKAAAERARSAAAAPSEPAQK
jgi:hypothetical protein